MTVVFIEILVSILTGFVFCIIYSFITEKISKLLFKKILFLAPLLMFSLYLWGEYDNGINLRISMFGYLVGYSLYLVSRHLKNEKFLWWQFIIGTVVFLFVVTSVIVCSKYSLF